MSKHQLDQTRPATYAVEIHDAAAEPHHTEHRLSTADTAKSAALHQWEAQTTANGFGLTPGSTVEVFALDVIEGTRIKEPGRTWAQPVARYVVERQHGPQGTKPFILAGV